MDNLKHFKKFKPLLISSLVLLGLVNGPSMISHASSNQSFNKPQPVLSVTHKFTSTASKLPQAASLSSTASSSASPSFSNSSESASYSSAYQRAYQQAEAQYKTNLKNLESKSSKHIDAKINNPNFVKNKSKYLKHHDKFYRHHHYGSLYKAHHHNHKYNRKHYRKHSHHISSARRVNALSHIKYHHYSKFHGLKVARIHVHSHLITRKIGAHKKLIVSRHLTNINHVSAKKFRHAIRIKKAFIIKHDHYREVIGEFTHHHKTYFVKEATYYKHHKKSFLK